MGIKEYRAKGGNKALLNEYHRKSDSLAQWQINFTKYDAQTYAFDHIGNGTPVSGYMPRGYNCGFIYDSGSERTIAHELGHGIAGLEHVFENSNASGKTANLMDNSIPETATELWHFQWDQIQDPSRVWMKWNKVESEGENVEWLDDNAKYVVWVAGKSVSKYTINTVLKEEVKETINKATKAFVIEVGTQFTINFIDALLCKKDNPVFWAISEIDFIDKAQLSLNSVTNYLPDNKNNKTLSEAIVCAEKACMALKKAKEDKDANALKDAAITCIFDVIINMDSHWIATKVPNKKIKTFCDIWSKIMKKFHQLYPNLSTASFIALGDILEQFYYHE